MLKFRPQLQSPACLAWVGLCLLACGQAPSSEPTDEPSAGPVEVPDPTVDVGAATMTDAPDLEAPPLKGGSASDPELWTPLDAWKGQSVETVREFYAQGQLKRIRTRLPEVVGPDGFHGPELVYHSNKTLKLVKTWLNGRPDGAFKTWFPNGLVKRMGNFDQGDLHGSLKEFWKIGSPSLEANYEHGKLHGRVAEYFAEDKLKDESYWNQGKQIGTHSVWSLTEALVLQEEYLGGVQDGSYLAFYASTAEHRIEGTYLAGKKTGVWRGWSEDGVLVGEEEFLEGERHGTRTAFVKGVLVERLEFDQGLKHGQQQEFYEDGAQRSEGRIDQGKRVDVWSYWKPDGSLLTDLSGTYKDDQKISD